MQVRRWALVWTLAAVGWASSAAVAGGEPAVGVQTIDQTWHDAARKRDVPVRIYLPTGEQTCPLIIFSHGLGGSREGYSYLGKYWAAHGYVAIHVTHHGSDTDVIRNVGRGIAAKMKAMRDAAHDLDAAIERPRDVSFAIDQALALGKQPGVLHGRIDAARIGVAGHSFGGYTAMAIAGQHRPHVPGFADPRVKAVIAMSPPAQNLRPADLADVHVPLLVMTGTLDDSPIGDTKAPDRIRLWEDCTHAPRYLSVFDGGDHMVFSGRIRGALDRLRGMNGNASQDEAFHQFILLATTEFWDAKLRGDAQADAWLDHAQQTMGKLGEWKVAPAE